MPSVGRQEWQPSPTPTPSVLCRNPGLSPEGTRGRNICSFPRLNSSGSAVWAHTRDCCARTQVRHTLLHDLERTPPPLRDWGRGKEQEKATMRCQTTNGGCDTTQNLSRTLLRGNKQGRNQQLWREITRVKLKTKKTNRSAASIAAHTIHAKHTHHENPAWQRRQNRLHLQQDQLRS